MAAPATAGLDYWRQRASRMGRRAVFDARHSDDELAAVTAMQKREIYPVLERLIRPWHHRLIDFGCGYGRFSGDLAELIDGRVLALDPVAEILRLAPPHPRVEYRLLDASGRVPAGDASADVVWCCLVFGTIHDDRALLRATGELARVLKPGGLCVVIENVSVKEGPPGPYRKRSVAEVIGAFPSISLAPLHQYVDIDETICIFGGLRRTE